MQEIGMPDLPVNVMKKSPMKALLELIMPSIMVLHQAESNAGRKGGYMDIVVE